MISARFRPWLAASASMLFLAACGGGSTQTAGTPAPTATPTPVVKTATAVVDGKSESILVDQKGMTLYYYTPDKGGKVTCTGQCAAIWPPLMLPAGTTRPSGDSGVTGTLGTVAGATGGEQVTYNGWPLYGWVKDKKPGDTTGQNVGGNWFVVTPGLASAV